MFYPSSCSAVVFWTLLLPLLQLANSMSIVDLQAQHHATTPIDTFKSMQTACQELGIDEFDIYGDYTKDANSSYLRKFEAEVAQDFGKDDAVFMPSGTMAQQIALLIHRGDDSSSSSTNAGNNKKSNNFFFCHHSSHLLLWEEESYSKLSGMNAIEIDTKSKAPSDGSNVSVPPMTLDDVQSYFDLERNALEKTKSALQKKTTLGESGYSSLIIELPHRELGGKLPSFQDVEDIGKLCKQEGVKYHCDGARVFEASAGYGMSVSEIAKPFDSFYISFYKGLGSISGAMLLGSKDFCDDARIWLSRFGGNLYTLLPYAVSCWSGYRRNHAFFLEKNEGGDDEQEQQDDGVNTSTFRMSFVDKFHKLKRVTEKIESETNFSNIASFDPPIPQTNMIHVYLKESLETCEQARDEVVEKSGLKLFSRLREVPSSSTIPSVAYRAYFEWTMGEANGIIEDEEYIKAWDLFCDCLDN